MVAKTTLPETLGDPVKHIASDALVANRWRQNLPELTVTISGGLVVILNLWADSSVERRWCRRSDLRQARLGLVTVPDPDSSWTVTVRGGGDVLFLMLPGVPQDVRVRSLFLEEDLSLSRLGFQALSLMYAGDHDPLALGQIRLGFDIALSPAPPPVNRGGLSRVQLRRCCEMIDAAVESAVPRSPSLTELADVAGVSVYHFAREFRRSTGETPYAYSVRRRVERARRLLVTTEDLVATVGYRCGFPSPAHFVQRFHKVVGMPPGRLRALLRA